MVGDRKELPVIAPTPSAATSASTGVKAKPGVRGAGSSRTRRSWRGISRWTRSAHRASRGRRSRYRDAAEEGAGVAQAAGDQLEAVLRGRCPFGTTPAARRRHRSTASPAQRPAWRAPCARARSASAHAGAGDGAAGTA